MEIISDKIFDFIYNMALRDATLRKAYQYPGEDGKNDKDKRKASLDRIRKNKGVRDFIKEEYIDKIINGNDPMDFYILADKILEKFDDENFSFGNAQKLINMTAKYMYIAAYNNDNYLKLREKFSVCHCPMDGIMVDKVIKRLREEHKDIVEKLKLNKDRYPDNNDSKKTLNWTGFLKQSWSRMKGDAENKNEQYRLFQEIVTCLSEDEKLIPIEYDYKYWNASDEKEDKTD